MRWQGLLGAVPVAAGGIALLELTRLPVDAWEGRVLAGATLALAESAVRQFAIPAAFVAVTALAIFLLETRWSEPGGGRRVGQAALVGLAVAQAACAREVLIAYHPFSWSFAANAAFGVFGLALAALHLALASPRLERHRRATLAAAAAISIGAVTFARVHYAVFVGQYPTLHACALCVAFLGLVLGLALAFAVVGRPRLTRGVAAAIAATLLIGAVLDVPSVASARPLVIAYTELGRAAGVARALERERDHLLPDTPPPRRTDPLLRPDPDAERRFARHAGLPALPEGFDLAEHDVLVILADATRHDRTSLARVDGPTPRLARFGAHAQVFERAYAPSNGTFPSVAAMLAMTPVSFAELDVRPRFWRGRLRDERTTVAEAMRAAGRRTFWVGHDHERCFSENIQGLEQGFDERVLIPEIRGRPEHADVDARIADAAIERLRRPDDRRFFGLVFFVSPHDDYRARGTAAVTDLERYDAELAYLDAQLGRLLDAVDLDRTVVVFAGDHGEAFGEHGHAHHLTSVHDEQIHVPLVVHVPGLPPARHPAPTSTAYPLPWLLLRGHEPARDAALRALTADVGPLMRALDGAVISEMIGPRHQQAALIWPDLAVTYDVFADLVRVYDPARDPAQLHDLRESRPDLLGRATPFVRRYRRARFHGRRFRFVEPDSEDATP